MDFSQWVPPGSSVVGQCSLCGGAVVAPTVWGGITPPSISCSKCGAVSRGHYGLRPVRTPALPILPMGEPVDAAPILRALRKAKGRKGWEPAMAPEPMDEAPVGGTAWVGGPAESADDPREVG